MLRGAFADRKGHVAVQIRDLDQTTIGNPAHDLVRLALSLASVARSSDLPGVTTARIVEQVIEGYEAALLSLDGDGAEEPATVRTVRREAMGRKWHHLAHERLGDIKPTIPLGKKFWELDADEKWALGVLLDSPKVKELILALNRRGEDDKVELVDAAYWMRAAARSASCATPRSSTSPGSARPSSRSSTSRRPAPPPRQRRRGASCRAATASASSPGFAHSRPISATAWRPAPSAIAPSPSAS